MRTTITLDDALVEVLELVNRNRLWGRGLGSVDAHLLGSVALAPGAKLWTRDKRCQAAGRELGIALLASPMPYRSSSLAWQ